MRKKERCVDRLVANITVCMTVNSYGAADAVRVKRCRTPQQGLLDLGRPTRISGKGGFFEHGVHDGLRAHDLARYENSIQDGLAGRLVRQRKLARDSQ